MTASPQDIRDRSFVFACEVARVALAMSPIPGVRCIVDQRLSAGTSIGANLEEAKSASSKREFLRYIQISLRESREAVYWLRLCLALRLADAEELSRLRDEGDQLVRILVAIVLNTKRRMHE